jgi:hypothetical protein
MASKEVYLQADQLQVGHHIFGNGTIKEVGPVIQGKVITQIKGFAVEPLTNQEKPFGFPPTVQVRVTQQNS